MSRHESYHILSTSSATQFLACHSSGSSHVWSAGNQSRFTSACVGLSDGLADTLSFDIGGNAKIGKRWLTVRNMVAKDMELSMILESTANGRSAMEPDEQFELLEN